MDIAKTESLLSLVEKLAGHPNLVNLRREAQNELNQLEASLAPKTQEAQMNNEPQVQAQPREPQSQTEASGGSEQGDLLDKTHTPAEPAAIERRV